MIYNDLLVDDIYNNFCLSSSDYHIGCCNIGDKGYFGNNAEEVYKNISENNVQNLDDVECYSFSPFLSNGKRYKMFYKKSTLQ